MKVRVGFVSNSSSSSFIFKLRVDKREPCKCCGRPFGGSEDAIESLDAMMFQDYEDRETQPLADYIAQERVDEQLEQDEETWIEGHLKKKGITDFDGLYIVSVSFHNEGRRSFLERGGDFIVIDNYC